MNNNELDNSQLTQEIKDLLNKLIQYLQQEEVFNELQTSLTAKMDKLDNLEVKSQSGFVQPEPLIMNEKNEKIVVSLGKEQDGDYRHFLLVEMLASEMKNNSPALTKGLASLLVNNSNGNLDNFALVEEENILNLLSNCYGLERVVDFVVNDKTGFLPNEVKDVKKIIELLDYNYHYRKKSKKSNYAQTQKAIIDAFLKKENITPEELENFQLCLCSDPSYISETGLEYPELESVEEYFQNAAANMSLEDVEKIKLS